MSLGSLRAKLRDLVDDLYTTDSQLNAIIQRATRKIERDLLTDGGNKPRQMQSMRALTADADGVLLPDDFLRMRTVKVNSVPFRYASADKVGQNEQDTAEVELYYYTKIPDLQETISNWVYDEAEDLYLYGASLQWAVHFRAEDKETWDTMYYDALDTVRDIFSPLPTGSWIQQKGRPYGGFYSIVGNQMRFSS